MVRKMSNEVSKYHQLARQIDLNPDCSALNKHHVWLSAVGLGPV